MAIAKVVLVMGLMAVMSAGYADSSMIGPRVGAVSQEKQFYVDVKNCTNPIKSSPYVMTDGAGNANMRLACPSDHPVMYSWQPGVVCCALNHRWVAQAAGRRR